MLNIVGGNEVSDSFRCSLAERETCEAQQQSEIYKYKHIEPPFWLGV